MKGFIILVLSVLIVGCSQDPIEDQPAVVREGVPPEFRKPDYRPKCPREAIQLDVEGELEFYEEIEGSVVLSARLLGCKATRSKIEVLSLPEGMEFDEATGKLVYTPALHAVTGHAKFHRGSIRVRVRTTSRPYVYRDYTLYYVVNRPGQRDPEIVSVELTRDAILETESTTAEVIVRDVDSHDGTNNFTRPPSLLLHTTAYNETDAIPFVSIANPNNPLQDSNDPSLWKFNVKVEPSKLKDPVSADEHMQFGLFAVSSFGGRSATEKVTVEVRNTLKQPHISWPGATVSNIKMKIGQRNTFNFWVFDPFGEGKATADFGDSCDNMPGDLTCKCKHVGSGSWNEGGSYCTISWDIPRRVTLKRKNFRIQTKLESFTNKVPANTEIVHRTIVLERPDPKPSPPKCPDPNEPDEPNPGEPLPPSVPPDSPPPPGDGESGPSRPTPFHASEQEAQS